MSVKVASDLAKLDLFIKLEMGFQEMKIPIQNLIKDTIFKNGETPKCKHESH